MTPEQELDTLKIMLAHFAARSLISTKNLWLPPEQEKLFWEVICALKEHPEEYVRRNATHILNVVANSPMKPL